MTPEKVQNFLPKNKVLAILFGTWLVLFSLLVSVGLFQLSRAFLEKKVPSYTAIPFMATAPIINPVVLFATYTAFGNSWYYVLLRFVGAFLIAMILGILLGFVVDDQILKDNRKVSHVHDYSGLSAGKKVFQALVHAVDEFFDTGRYLIFGSLVAASMQTYLPTVLLTTIGHNSVTAILIMMLLASSSPFVQKPTPLSGLRCSLVSEWHQRLPSSSLVLGWYQELDYDETPV